MASHSTKRSPTGLAGWDSHIPPHLRPAVRAYLIGHVSSVGLKLGPLLLKHVLRLASKPASTPHDAARGDPFLPAAWSIIRRGLDPRAFPAFCALLVGGTTFLVRPLQALFDRFAQRLSPVARKRLSRWFATFIAAWLSLTLLQSRQPAASLASTTNTSTPSPSGGHHHHHHPPAKLTTAPSPAKLTTAPSPAAPPPPRTAGRTLDLTLFALTRALDILLGALWARRRRSASSRPASNRWTAALESSLERLADPALFALSSGLVMWAWIYHPSRLPRAYDRWIGKAAQVDRRLITALQRCRTGELRYGRDTGERGRLLEGMCAERGWPRAWGDPEVAVPFPCVLVHGGWGGGSCEAHAVVRFVRSFRWALGMYLPLGLGLAGVRARSVRALVRALPVALRSSSFLAAFITLFYYGVCLARTRVGPRLFGRGAAAAQRIDGGLCVAAGCVLCGWSILLEGAARKKDMALFVAPRALAILFPRRYPWEKQWRETLAFSASTAVVFTCALENKERVRGAIGTLLGYVLGELADK